MAKRSTPAYWSGTSGLVLPLKQSEFPPEFAGASRLTYFASLFSSVEINSSFYQVPKGATVQKWHDSVPDDFRFTFKVPKAISHVKGLQFNVDEVAQFGETVAAIGKKRGCLLLQLPPSAKRDLEEELEGLLECLTDDAAGWNIAVEFRHVSWYDKAVYRMLQRHGAGMVEQDMPKAPTPELALSEQFAYLRFHGPDGSYRGTYDDAFLEGRADRVTQLRKEGREVYVYFNNTMGAALQNLQTLNELVARRLP